jgi:spore coat polysaccharide biosynthesis protein SpsF
LKRAWRDANQIYEREHVTPFFYEHPDWFCIASLRGDVNYSHYRWTLDTADDLVAIRSIYAQLGNRDDFGWRDALTVMERVPQIAHLNSHVMQKPLHGD